VDRTGAAGRHGGMQITTDTAELERRLEAYLLIARKVRAAR
jgi:hypothetical protein